MRFVTLILMCALLQSAERVNATGFPTEFEFSSSLVVSGKPAKGSYNFEFVPYRTPVGGAAVGTTATLSGVKLQKGAYSGRLDFGAGVFTGEPVWIEVRYQKLGQAPLPFETSPTRIAIGAVPLAMASEHAITADFATTASFAAVVDFAQSSGNSATATFATSAGHSGTADNATTAAHALSAFTRGGAAYEVVLTSDDSTQNGVNLLATYSRAKALTPHGAALSDTNRVAVLVPPASYNLGAGQLLLDTEFVDVIGLSTNQKNQYIYSQANGSNTGVLRQTANNVRVENLQIHCTRAGTLPGTSDHPASYFPDSNKPECRITNCAFTANSGAWTTRLGVEYSGYYSNCSGGEMAFGGQGVASGTFLNSTALDLSFGSLGTASGKFTNCNGGLASFGGLGIASRTFTGCVGGQYAFAGNGTASGTFTNCIGDSNAFGSGVTASGTFTACTAGNHSFAANGTAGGTFTNCTGGTSSFGGGIGVATGARFYYCRGGSSSFGFGHSVRLFCIQNDTALP